MKSSIFFILFSISLLASAQTLRLKEIERVDLPMIETVLDSVVCYRQSLPVIKDRHVYFMTFGRYKYGKGWVIRINISPFSDEIAEVPTEDWFDRFAGYIKRADNYFVLTGVKKFQYLFTYSSSTCEFPTSPFDFDAGIIETSIDWFYYTNEGYVELLFYGNNWKEN